MKLMLLKDVHDFIKQVLDDKYAATIFSGTVNRDIEKSINLLPASSSRNTNKLSVGGVDNATVFMRPINILVHWTNSSFEHDQVVQEVFESLLGLSNMQLDNSTTKVAYVDCIDGGAEGLERDATGICESTIRLNIYYYL